jgi:hypothetical protein
VTYSRHRISLPCIDNVTKKLFVFSCRTGSRGKRREKNEVGFKSTDILTGVFFNSTPLFVDVRYVVGEMEAVTFFGVRLSQGTSGAGSLGSRRSSGPWDRAGSWIGRLLRWTNGSGKATEIGWVSSPR